MSQLPSCACYPSNCHCFLLINLARSNIKYFVPKPSWSNAPESTDHPGCVQVGPDVLFIQEAGAWPCCVTLQYTVYIPLGWQIDSAPQSCRTAAMPPVSHCCCPLCSTPWGRPRAFSRPSCLAAVEGRERHGHPRPAGLPHGRIWRRQALQSCLKTMGACCGVPAHSPRLDHCGPVPLPHPYSLRRQDDAAGRDCWAQDPGHH